MKIIAAVIFSCCFMWLPAQKAEPLLFKETVHDFGSVPEKGGPVEYEFGFVNNTGQPLVLVNVEASCGCTTPEWSRDPIAPGKQGFVRARFDPEGRPGFFRKNITITTSPETGQVILQLTGNVTEGKPAAATEIFDHSIGELLTRSSGFNLGKVYINQEATTRNFALRNGGKVTMEITGVDAPAHLRLTYPARLKPGETGTLSIRYDGRKKNTYGFVTDQVTLKTNDEDHPEKHYPVFATLEESFAALSEEDRKNAPRMLLTTEEIKFGELQGNATLEREITFTNTGKRELIIRSLVPNCTCLSAKASTERIAAGGTGKLQLTFSAAGRSGRQNKSVMVYSNDPERPVQRITLTGTIR